MHADRSLFISAFAAKCSSITLPLITTNEPKIAWKRKIDYQ